jgi:hypothetical protein
MNPTAHDMSRITNERGAVLLQVTVALLALLALSGFVFDYGVMWVSRGQAQTSADAGALAGSARCTRHLRESRRVPESAGRRQPTSNLLHEARGHHEPGCSGNCDGTGAHRR